MAFDAVLSILHPLSSILASVFVSPLRQVIRGKDETFNSLTACDPFHDFWQIGHRDVTVKEVIGLDQDTDATGTLVETTRGAGASAEWGQPARGQLFLQGQANLFRALVGTRSLFVIRTAPVRTDKEIALSLRHPRRLAADAPAVNHTPRRARAANRTGMPNSNSADFQHPLPNRSESFS
jgi:hypothetical protein